MIRINSHPNIPTAFDPGHKATNQIDKYAGFGRFSCNVAILSIRDVHKILCDFVCIMIPYIFV